jgi:hypothetical protein
MKHKTISDMTTAEYQAYVRRIEKRHGPDRAWEELPVIRRPGRPAKGRRSAPLRPRSVKLPDAVWRSLAVAAKRHGVTASGVVAGLALHAMTVDDLDAAITRLIKRRILTPA